MFLKKMSRPLSKIPVSIRVTVWFTAVIIFLFSIVLSSAILLEDRYINDSSTEELVSAVEKIYEDPDEFENFDDGIYYIKYNENNEIIAGKIPKDFDLTLAFSIEDINTYQIENKKFLYYDTRLKNTGDWIRGIYPLSRFQNDISKMWDIVFYYIAPLFIAFVAFVGYKIVKNAFNISQDYTAEKFGERVEAVYKKTIEEYDINESFTIFRGEKYIQQIRRWASIKSSGRSPWSK